MTQVAERTRQMREPQPIFLSGTGNGFERSAFAQLIAGSGGRIGRVVAGVALIGLGLRGIGSTIGYIVALVGLVPLAAGVFDFCVLSPIFGASFWGRDIRVAGR